MRNTIFTLTAFFLLFTSQESRATHILGSDIQWKSLSNDTFEITMVVYRNCTDGVVQLSITPPTVISDSCSTSQNRTDSTKISHQVEEVTPICNALGKVCPSFGGSGQSSVTMPYGVEKHTFRYKVYLGGSSCCWYKVHWEQSARVSSLTTGLADQNFVTEALLNRCTPNGDQSPVFSNTVTTLYCAGQDVSYDPMGNDPDGDSLSYQMAPPQGGGSYFSPWSYRYPITCLGGNNPNPNANPPTGFNLDSITGIIRFRPMQVQNTVFRVSVKEWRKDSTGVYRVIGVTPREMLVSIIQNCSNKLPGLSGPFTYEACANQEICLTINTTDQDLGDTTRIYWNNSIPNASWSNENDSVKNSSGQLCWTPSLSDASTVPYYFTVRAEDNHCPASGSTTRSYSIMVSPAPKTTRALTAKSCTAYQFTTTLIDSQLNGVVFNWYLPKLLGSGVPSVIYSTKADTTYTFPASGTYVVKSTVRFNTCIIAYLDTIKIDSFYSFSAAAGGNTQLCPGDSVLLVSDSVPNYQWYKNNTIITGATQRNYYAKEPGKYTVSTNGPGCLFVSNAITVTELSDQEVQKASPLCQGDSVRYFVPANTGATVQWYRNGNTISGANGNTFYAKQDGYYYAVITRGSCTVQTTKDTLVFLSLPPKPTIIMNGATLFTYNGGLECQWYRNGFVIVNAKDSFYNTIIGGVFQVRITGVNGCSILSDPFTLSTGIGKGNLKQEIHIAPNPFYNELRIDVGEPEKPVKLALYDLQGRLIMEQTALHKQTVLMDTERLSNGIFLLHVSDEETSAIFRVIKQE